MYPIARFAKEIFINRNAPPLGVGEAHVSHHVCWPIDIDPFFEMNNGRTLTLYDLGRMMLLYRIGAVRALRAQGWVGTIAGSSVRYRRRVRAFDRIEMKSRLVGWDERFTYVEQSMWRRSECTSHALLRLAVTGGTGIVPSADVAAAMDADPISPPLPGWIAAWAAAEAQRPWPPTLPA